MKTYQYKGVDALGQSCRGLIEGLSPKDAREKLARRQILVERLSVTGRSPAFPPDARSATYRELATLLTAGVPIVRAFEMLIDSTGQRARGPLLAGVRDRVREGMSLAAALSGITAFERAVIDAGERSGALATVLGQLADFLDSQARVRERVQRAMLYPAIVIAAGICVAIVMLGLLVPRTEAIFAETGQRLPALTRGTIAFGRGVLRFGPAIVVLLIALGAWARLRLKRSPAAAAGLNRRAFAVPILGENYAWLCSLRFARTLAILLRGGVPLVDGVAIAGEATGSAWVASLAAGEADAVRHGARLSVAVGRIPPLSEALSGWIGVGEESGELPGMLEHAAGWCAERWERGVSRALVLLEPLLLLLIGAFVLLITLSVLLPILSLTHAVSLP